jgi:hypothetical protein
MNSRAVSCDKYLWNWALVIALSLHEKVELTPSVVCTGEHPKEPMDRFN